jgi:hypothetical protein
MFESDPFLFKKRQLRLIVLKRHGKSPQRHIVEDEEVNKERQRYQNKFFLFFYLTEKLFSGFFSRCLAGS